MPLNLFIIGPSGSGKSTQAKLIAQKYNLTHLSMGQILRDEIESASPLGLKAKEYLDQGIPAPDDIVVPLVKAKLNSLSNQNFIIDGFPRLIDQGVTIESYLKSLNNPIDLLIHLLCDFEEILRRRQTNPDFQKDDKDRSDNNPKAIANRQKILYEANVNPVIDYFKSQNILFEVDGNRPIEPIFQDIVAKLNLLINSKESKN